MREVNKVNEVRELSKETCHRTQRDKVVKERIQIFGMDEE